MIHLLDLLAWFPEDVSLDGYRIDDLFWFTVTLTSIFFGLVCIILGYCLIRYRAREGHEAVYLTGNDKKSVIITILLGLTVFFSVDMNLVRQSFADWNEAFGNFPASDEAVRIQVMGRQFQWFFRYAGDDGDFGTADDIWAYNPHIPVDKPVIFQMKSKDVIHSLFFPNFRIKTDTVPGRITGMWMQATKTGEFDIACAELCGLSHTRMKARLIVESDEAFQKWLKDQYEMVQYVEEPMGNWGWEWIDFKPSEL